MAVTYGSSGDFALPRAGPGAGVAGSVENAFADVPARTASLPGSNDLSHPMPQPHVVEAIVREVRRLPGYPSLSVLDLSCGEAEVLTRLGADGCRVHGTHFREDDYIVADRSRLGTLAITTGVDLQKPLPFPDAAFDVVLLTEVLEHLDSHFGLLMSLCG
jgi:2-polyprenyl-3-methyl-5-hydroxy-6-metoxy-1,4-benzoquinol methylase